MAVIHRIGSLIILAIDTLVYFETFMTILTVEEVFPSTVFAVYVTILFIKNIWQGRFKLLFSFKKRYIFDRIKIHLF